MRQVSLYAQGFCPMNLHNVSWNDVDNALEQFLIASSADSLYGTSFRKLILMIQEIDFTIVFLAILLRVNYHSAFAQVWVLQ